ncbi:MAG TPA: hydantoinase/oxoprolinase family protein [Thermoanaerobaculia bacterium]|nr:hydantoinase/oxoprolinase family protein [Thermoanaerobaculia bacterium]
MPAAGEQGRAAARAGETGREGAAGEPGRDGAAAEPGREGAAGEAGREGAAAEGTAGEPGREGAAGEGTAGEPGREGTAGEPGREGEAGRDGAAGGEVVLAGLLAIADERMAEAIRGISLRRGYDPAEYALVAFGGAGPQHACAVAALLGMDTVLVPADASLLSALGLGAAVVERFAQRQVLAPLAEVAGRLDGWCEELGREAAAAVAAEGVPLAAIEVRRRIVALRFAGQESTLTVDYHGAAGLAAAFAAAYREVYGYDLNEAAAGAAEAPVAAAPQTGQRRGPAPAAAVGVDEARDDRGEPRPPAGPQGRAIEVESLRVVASSGSAAAGGEEEGPKRPGSGDGGAAGLQVGAGSGGGARVAAGEGAEARRAFMAGAWRQVPAYERGALAPGAAFEGPALVLEDHTATVVAAGWSCRLDRAGALVLRRQRSGIAGQDDGRAARRDGEGQG